MLACNSKPEHELADEDLSSSTSGTGFLNDILKEPLVHFLVLAALLFVLQAVFTGDTRELISVDADTQEYLFQQRQDLTLQPVSDEEKQQIIEDFVRNRLMESAALAKSPEVEFQRLAFDHLGAGDVTDID